MLKLFYIIACLVGLVNGLWMLFFPLSWYADFPAAIEQTGPFNAHFVRDLGITYLVATLGFGWCAMHLERSRTVHLGLTIFFAGHALLHVADLLAGRLPAAHWLVDAPSVFAPALLLIVLAIPSVRRRLGEG